MSASLGQAIDLTVKVVSSFQWLVLHALVTYEHYGHPSSDFH